VLRFSIRELFWLTLVFAIGTAWWTESYRTRLWRERAEIAASQIEAENLGRLVFKDNGVLFQNTRYLPPFNEVFTPTDPALLNSR
jgi:hypothetical protein